MHSERLDKIRQTFSTKSTTWINLEPLSYPAISTLVARTLHRPKDDVSHLPRLIHGVSEGNPFTARNILMTLYRQRHVRILSFLRALAVLMVVRVGCRSGTIGIRIIGSK